MTVLRRKLARDIRKDKARYFAVAFLVFLGLLVYASTWFAYKGLDQSYRRTSENLKYNDIFIRTAPAPGSSVDQVAALEGVETVLGRLTLDTGGRMPDGSEIKLHLIGMPTAEQPLVNSLYMENGSYFEPGAQEECIAESHLAEYYGLEPGARLSIATPGGMRELEVRGRGASSEYFMVYAEEGSEYIATPRNYGVVFVPEGWLQEAMGMPDTVNEYSILTSEGSDKEAVLARAQAVLAPYGVIYGALGSDQPARKLLDIDVQTFKELSEFFPFLFLVVAAFSLYMVITRLVFSQRKTVGTMMSYGMNTKKIARHYLSYSAMVWVAGSFAGIAAGYFVAREMTRMYAQSLGIPLVTAGMDWRAAALGCAVTLLICIVAGCIPLVRLLRQTPARVLKGGERGRGDVPPFQPDLRQGAALSQTPLPHRHPAPAKPGKEPAAYHLQRHHLHLRGGPDPGLLRRSRLHELRHRFPLPEIHQLRRGSGLRRTRDGAAGGRPHFHRRGGEGRGAHPDARPFPQRE